MTAKKKPAIKLPSAKALIVTAIAIIAANFLIFLRLDSSDAASFGDAFGFSGALLTGIALVGVAASLRQIDDSQDQQKEILRQQEEQLRRQQGQIDALASIAMALTDPVIVARIELSNDTLYYLVVENIGKQPAYNLRFTLHPSNCVYPAYDREIDLSSFEFIKNGLHSMAPGQKISTIIASGEKLQNWRDANREFQSEFFLSITYFTNRTDNTEKSCRHYDYSFDFNTQIRTMQHRNEIAKEIHLIKNLLEKSLEVSSDQRSLRISVKK